MPDYVYGCDADRTHPRVEVTHRMDEDPEIRCACGAKMHRVPQPMRGFYRNPEQVIARWLTEESRLKRLRKPRPNRYRCVDPDGIPGRDFHTRSYKESVSNG